MFYTSEIYRALTELHIPFERVETDDKPFRSKDFSAALEVPRVSFAPAELMSTMLGTKIGAATIFSTLPDTENLVQIIIDKDILVEEWYGCSDGTTTGYMKVRTTQMIHDFSTFSKHTPRIIEV